MKKSIIILVLVAVIIGGGYLATQGNQDDDQRTSQQNTNQQPDKVDDPEIKSFSDFDFYGVLADKTDSEVRGVSTNSNARGQAGFSFENDKFELLAQFDNLPDPSGDDFYEGWLVQPEPFVFISTGRVNKVNGAFVNNFSSDQDYRTYYRYILTLEPNDGDPKPSEFHILEGDLSLKATDPAAQAGFYGAYEQAKLANATSGDVVLFFNASWCPTCKVAKEHFQTNRNNIPSSLTILDLDYDSETDLKKKYGVTTQHTFVQVDENGNELAQWTGGYTVSDLLDMVI